MFTALSKKKEKCYYTVLGIEQDLNTEIILEGKIVKNYPLDNYAIIKHNSFNFEISYNQTLLEDKELLENDKIKVEGLLKRIKFDDDTQTDIKFGLDINQILEMPDYADICGRKIIDNFEYYNRRKYVHLDGRVCNNYQQYTFKFRDKSLKSDFIYISCSEIENYVRPCFQSKIEVWGQVMGLSEDGIPICLAVRMREYDIKPEYENKNGSWLYDEDSKPIHLIVQTTSKLINNVGLDYLLKLQSSFEFEEDSDTDIENENTEQINARNQDPGNIPHKYYTSHFRKYQEYKDFWDEVRDTLKKADEITKSQEYKKATQYFKVLKHRGILLETPSYKNGYSLVFSDCVVVDDEVNVDKEYEPYQLDILKECAPEFLDELLDTVSRQCEILHRQNLETKKNLQLANDTLDRIITENSKLKKENATLKATISDLKEESLKSESRLKKVVRSSTWKTKK